MPPLSDRRILQGDALSILRNVFGFHSFRPHQEEIVRAILGHRDAFVVMPTGGGKSLCYQLPAHIMPGTCMVISPLISLMKDQVDAAAAIGLDAACLNSSMTGPQRSQVQRQLTAGELALIYVSPERFAMADFIDTLRNIKLSFVAIDEAHCISEWGHDFRPDYLNLSQIVEEFPEVPVAAFTATATRRVQKDIIARLGLRSPHLVRASFNRPNLFYKVVPKQKAGVQILKHVQEHAGEPGIVYRTTRRNVVETADMLTEHGIKALPYHAGLDDEIRTANQDAFNRDEAEVIVATIAFGMGIDKSNVRYVLHGDLPKNVESYYQETGRSGRDGEPAHCLLLFGYGDIPKIRFFIDQMTDENEKQHAIRCLNDMVHYATVYVCRRKQLLQYFGEKYEDKNCGTCDICAGEIDRVDATRDAQIVLSAIARTGQRFGINYIADIITGAGTQRIRQSGHDQIKTYGVGKDKAKRHWRVIIDNLLARELIAQSDGQYPVLQMQPEARDVLFGDTKVFVLQTTKVASKRKAPEAGPYSEELFQVLRQVRKRLAAGQNVPPYVVFSDRTLHEMARSFPRTESDMMLISGVGKIKLARYGPVFIAAIRDFLQNPTGEK